MLFRSIRTRLTLWYVAILAAILILFAAGVYVTMRHTLNDNLNDTLANRAFLTQQLVTVDASGKPQLGDAADPSTDDTFRRLFGVDGAVLDDNSAAFGQPEIDQTAIQKALSGQRDSGTVSGGEEAARVLTTPIERDGTIIGALQVGQSTSDLNDTLRALLFVSTAGLVFALALAAAGGYWLSTRALAPIDDITSAARDISEHDLSRRLALDLPDDEVGRLARTFDGMIARLDAAFQRQRQFTADASHELRTPLTAIRGQIDVALQRPREASEYRQTLATVNEQVDRMTRLVGGLLLLARADAGAIAVDRERVDVEGLVRSVEVQVRPFAEQRGLSLVVEGEHGATVVGDEDLLLQLLLNLADNAVKYTSRGGVSIGWSQQGDAVRISVRDTGPGIGVDDQPRVFERFYRVNGARSREDGGAGLGLAISRWIATLHDGDIGLESSHAGSTFTVRLPSA